MTYRPMSGMIGLGCVLAVLAGGLVGADRVVVAQPAPVVQAQEVEGALPVVPQGEAPAEPAWPKLPALDEVPPMPMPEPPPPGAESLGVVGTLLVHDALTGETTELSEAESLPLQALMGGSGGDGYAGADGGGGSEVMPESFGTMSRITNTGDSPWRMNAKLLMRFRTTGGADAWFVCSGSMVDAETVLTAAHCVYSRDANIADWAQEIYVYPGWDGAGDMWPPPDPVNAYGWARGTWYAAGTGYVTNGDTDADCGVVEITRAVGMLTGWYGWTYGQDCAWIQSRTYNNVSYPSENCPDAGLHNGVDMYYWFGTVDACPNNQMQLNTGGGHCFDTVWGGMSGSGMYWIDGSVRRVHAVCSTSNRFDRGYYCKLWQGFADYMSGTFIPGSRGTAFDVQALDCNAEPATIAAGSQTTLLNHLAVNPTNNDPASATYTYRVYLSPNDVISSTDTLLSTQNVTWDFAVMGSVRVNMVQVTIPANTSPGTYWLGLEYDAATDGNTSNNATNGWDAVRITVTCPSQTAPTSVAASDGTYTTDVWVTWTAATGAATYEVWRNTVNNSGTATRIAQSLTSTWYADTSATPGADYYYWVKAKNACGNTSGFSAYDMGWRALSPPTTVSASDGLYTGYVRVGCTVMTGATHYQFYRATVNNPASASAISAWQASASYDDTSATPGVVYYYWAKAATSSGGARASGFSGADSGWRALTAPGSVVASDGTYWAYVRITWGSVTGASHYQVYRNTVNNSGTASAVSGWVMGTVFNDTTAVQGQVYYYWVQAAVDSAGTRPSGYGGPDTGWRNWEPPFVIAAVSSKRHGGVNYDVNLLPPAVEGRANSAMKIVVTFDKPIQALGGLDASDVNVSSGTITGMSMGTNDLSVTIESVADAIAVGITYPGIAEASHSTAVVTDSVCVGTLVGDVTGDGKTNVLDLVQIRNNLNQAVTASNFRADVNVDNGINVLDLVAVRNNLNRAIVGSCP